jgi:hypothetical protein
VKKRLEEEIDMVYRGCINHGVVVLDGDVRLAEGTPVVVETLDALPSSSDPDSFYRIGELAAPTGIPDLAMNIDHYLYGHPKVSDVPT